MGARLALTPSARAFAPPPLGTPHELLSVPADAVPERALAGGPVVLPRRRADADLRHHAHRQFRAWLVLHAGRVHRLLRRAHHRQLLVGADRRTADRGRGRHWLRGWYPAAAVPARRKRVPDGDVRADAGT